MAIASGVRPHTAFIEAGGARFAIPRGNVSLAATMESSDFSVTIPMSQNGAEDAFALPSGLDAKIIVNDETLFTGFLDEGQFDYIARVITVSGRCKSSKLHNAKVSKSWQNKKPDEIIKDLAKQAGVDVDVSALQAQLKAGRLWDQDWVKLSGNVSASSTIHKLCEMMGWRWWIDADGKITVKDKSAAGGSYSVMYVAPGIGPLQSDAMQLSVRRNYQASQGVEVTVKSWDQKKKKTHEKKAKVKAASGDGTGGVGESLKYEYQVPSLDDDHVERFAKSKAREHARHQVQIDLTCVGDTSCRAGMQLQLSGTRFAGIYDIDRVDHHFGMSGYVMHISARTDPPEATTE